MIAPSSLAAVHVFFPDPWPKKRHWKRRLIQPPFVALLASRLAPGGTLHCATDWQPYAEQMLEVLSAEPLLANTAEGYAPRPDYRPLTKFENRGLALGHGVWDLVFNKRVSPATCGTALRSRGSPSRPAHRPPTPPHPALPTRVRCTRAPRPTAAARRCAMRATTGA